MKILVTGGAGYIGSTTCSALIDNGHTPIILDSLVNGRREFVKNRIFYEGDVDDKKLIERIFTEHPDIVATIHFAGFIVIPESVEKPYEYYRNNVSKAINFFKTLIDQGCNKIIFSSTAALYSKGNGEMVTEDIHVEPTSPYARTKLMIEYILEDYCMAYGIKGIALRYFNPIGADPKMRSGAYAENPSHVLGILNVLNKEINKEEAPPRPGDVAGAYANANKALNLLNWKAELSIEQAISDAIKWNEIFRSTLAK
ncbi:MAG: NAD-dependent epimerase/dehydratase family protein [Oscillospiraceae bacterium]|nr:NAD-dependent epimerase/dehydratase family protein [Oscillospiraceae bacterium]